MARKKKSEAQTTDATTVEASVPGSGRVAIINDLAAAIDELRARASGAEPEADLAANAADCLEIIDGDETLADLRAAVEATVAQDASEDDVLAALSEADRAEVLLLVEALAAEDVGEEGNGQEAEATQRPSDEATQVEEAKSATAAAEHGPAAEATSTARAFARLCDLVIEGVQVEEADKAQREAQSVANEKRAEIKAAIKAAEYELRRVEHEARAARTKYMRLAQADRGRVARVNAQVRTLAEAVRRDTESGLRPSENVRRVLDAAAKGEPITTDLV